MSKKDDERVDKDRLLEIVQDLCVSKDFEAEFEAFAKEHANVFMQALDLDEGKSDEHPLVFHDIYRKYLAKFEGIIEQCILKTGYSVGDFYDQCKDILDNDEVFGTKRFFIETMLATSEYETFLMLMRAEMRDLQAAQQRNGNHK